MAEETFMERMFWLSVLLIAFAGLGLMLGFGVILLPLDCG